MKLRWKLLIPTVLVVLVVATVVPGLLPLSLTDQPVFGGIWQLQPRLDRVTTGAASQPVTTNAFTITFDPDGPLTATIAVQSPSDLTGTLTTHGAMPPVTTSIADLYYDPSTPTAVVNGKIAAWYLMQLYVATYTQVAIYPVGPVIAAGENPVMEWDSVTVSTYFTVNLQETALFNESCKIAFEKVGVVSCETGMDGVPYDSAMLQAIVEDWHERSIEPFARPQTAANLIDSLSADGQTANCHATVAMRAGGEFTPSTWVSPLQRTANAKYTVHNVYALFTLRLQVLMDEGTTPPAVPWWEVVILVLQDLVVRVRNGWERILDALGAWFATYGMLILALIVFLVVCYLFLRFRRGGKHR